MARQAIRKQELLETAIEQLGYECVGMEYINAGRHSVLRIYIDRPEGITVDDCGAVSHQVSGILDVEELIKGVYDLEVSSPGLERPLFKFNDYGHYLGRTAKIRLAVPADGRRNFTGVLKQAVDQKITVDVDGSEFELNFEQIERAKLVPEYE